MDKRIREAYNDAILAEAMKRYGIAKDSIHLLDGFESFIYEYEKGGQDYVLRVSHSLHRTSDLTQGEIEWVNYLADNGVPAARAIPSERGKLVEPIAVEDGSHFTAASFERARGDHPTKKDWENGLAVKLGQIVGRMHALTKHYEPSDVSSQYSGGDDDCRAVLLTAVRSDSKSDLHPPQVFEKIPSDVRFRRHEWYDDYPDGFAEQYLPPSETVVIEKFNRLLEYLHTLPRDRDSYGLIHVDVHGGNFFVDDGKITLFDFDDCQYAWFVYDIAMALFYVLPHNCVGEENISRARGFLEQFLESYRRENAINSDWLRQIPYFLKLREMDLYVVIHRSCNLDDLDPWCASFMDNRKYKIQNDVPYVKLDWG